MDMNESKKRRAMITYVLIGLVVLAVLNAVVAPAINMNPVQEVPYTQLLSMADEGKVDEVEYNLSSGGLVDVWQYIIGAVFVLTILFMKGGLVGLVCEQLPALLHKERKPKVDLAQKAQKGA